MKQIAIRASALTLQFSSVRALNDLTIEVLAGVVFGFLGPNGAGKTTTIRLLLNLIAPTSGSAEVLGFDTRTSGLEIRSRCGSLLEHSGLYERLSAEDNIRFYGRVAHMTERDIDCRSPAHCRFRKTLCLAKILRASITESPYAASASQHNYPTTSLETPCSGESR